MTESLELLTGRIVANKQMIAQCENEIKQLEGTLKRMKPAPKPVVEFMNVYKDSYTKSVDTKQKADAWASPNRLACLKVTYDPATNTASAEVV